MCQQNVASGIKVLGNATKLPRILNKATESSGEAQRTQKLTWRQKLYGNNKPKLTTCKYVENRKPLHMLHYFCYVVCFFTSWRWCLKIVSMPNAHNSKNAFLFAINHDNCNDPFLLPILFFLHFLLSLTRFPSTLFRLYMGWIEGQPRL